MGCRIIQDNEEGGSECAFLCCSVTGLAFGPLIHEDEKRGLSAYDNAQAFILWLERTHDKDPRQLSSREMANLFFDQYLKRKEPEPCQPTSSP
jgi:hypothetical protein